MKKLFGGLPEELEPMEDLSLEGARFRVTVEQRRYGKNVTLVSVEGWTDDQVKGLATDLKTLLGAGGTSKDHVVELQGDHRRRVKQWLTDKGYAVSE